MFEILTPMEKVERVSRAINPTTFVATPGIWALLYTDGSLRNVAATVNNLINKLVIGSASSNVYESHDVEVGRIATMESFGIRCQTDSQGFTTAHGVPVLGDQLVVSTNAATLGKLIPLRLSTPGTYEVVARVEGWTLATSVVVYKTLSPVMVTNASSASSSASPSTSPSGSTSPSASASA
jgi:hypothetical protein